MSYFIENFTHKDLLMNEDLESLGHFLTLDLENSNEARSLHEKLEKHNIQTDFRDNRLRFGFGMYLAKDDLHKVMKTINESL